MKFYIAGKFENKEIVREIYQRVQALGHEISYDWTTHENVKPYVENVAKAKIYAENELKAILESDVFVYLTNEQGTTLHMEFGAALAKAESGNPIRIYAVGEYNNRSPWYFNPLVTRVDSTADMFLDLEG